MNREAKIWLIDENADELKTYGGLLSKVFETEGQVHEIEPKPTKNEMKFVIDDPNTCSIVNDEKLKNTGIAQYLGIELAVYFRALNTKMPIYILTNFSEDRSDLGPGEWSVEYIIDKEELQSNFTTIRARMRRNVSFYNDYLDEREKRFNDLLMKSLNSTISQEEIQEFKELQYIRAKSILSDELGISSELKNRIQEQLAKIAEFESE
ncbi:MAG: hypothetical protein PHQ86_09315 [Dehalococcoidales bacterium]|nr:hypothetical protein [Dehalococcoidales bacterium]